MSIGFHFSKSDLNTSSKEWIQRFDFNIQHVLDKKYSDGATFNNPTHSYEIISFYSMFILLGALKHNSITLGETLRSWSIASGFTFPSHGNLVSLLVYNMQFDQLLNILNQEMTHEQIYTLMSTMMPI